MLTQIQDAIEYVRAIPYLSLFVSLGWFGYLAVLGVWIVLQKREPVATLSWLMSLTALPYLGFLIYYFLGPQRITRQRLRRVKARARLPRPPEGMTPSEVAIEHARLGQATTGLPPTTATHVKLLVDGAAKYDALIAAIRAARERIHVHYYIYEPDETGTMVRDALVERARAGVEVRLLLDAVGSRRVGRRFLRPLVEAGGEYAWFHPSQPAKLWRRPWLNLRTHRKIVTIDGLVGFTGGINVTDEENERLRADAYRDLHLRMEGEVVQSLDLVFVEDWAYATATQPLTIERAARARGAIATQVLVSGPDSPWEPIHRMQVSSIHAATKRVWLVTPYFVPGEAARMALTSAALGGLDVRLVVPKMSDSRLVTYAARSYFEELLQAGVRIYEYGPRMLHTKALVCDDDVAIIGTANFDNRSFRLNFEVCTMFRDTGVTGELAALIAEECRASEPVRRDRVISFPARLAEAFARLCSPLL